jgi:predicted PurR-regulated permease PerM
LSPGKTLEAARPSITVLAGIVLLAAILSLARAVLIPIALAILLTFILTPFVVALQRRRVSRTVAVLSVMLAALGAIGGGIYAISVQLHDLAVDLPAHKDNLKAKVQELKGGTAGPLTRSLRMVEEVTEEVVPGPSGSPFVTIAVKQEKTGLEVLSGAAMPLIGIIGSVGLVIALTLSMLFKREDLRNRLIRLAGHGRLAHTTRAMDEATRLMSRYLVLQLFVNAGFGLVFGLGMAALGVPYAVLWGFLAMIVRFIPYIGTWMAAVLPLFVSFAVSTGWLQPLGVIVFTVVVGLLVNNLIEPLLISRTTRVSPVALVIAAAFWTWLWGPIGLVLSTPMTVCLGVLGRYVPPLSFLDVLFGTDPALDPRYGYYQRLLARDEVEAAQVVEAYLQGHTLEELHDQVLLPVLVRVKEDLSHGHLHPDDVNYLIEATDDILEDVGLKGEPAAPLAGPEGNRPQALVVASPAKDRLDELALHLFRQLLGPRCRVEVLGLQVLLSEMLEHVRRERPEAVVLAAVHPGGLAKIRYLCKRLRQAFPHLPILVGYWGLPVDDLKLGQQLQDVGASSVAVTISESCLQLESVLKIAPHLTPVTGPEPQPGE